MATTTTTSQTETEPQPRSALLSSLQRDGFVVIPSLLSPSQLSSLRSAASHVTEATRQGKWPFFRTVPKQFPPWPKDVPPPSSGGIWGVQHLLHPSMPYRETFASLYFSSTILNPVKELLNLPPDSPSSDSSLVMELFNLLVSPTSTDFELVWHRDDIRPNLSPAEEWAELQSKSPNGLQFHTQYNIALYDDDSLIAIPGSHRRVRTETERTAAPLEPSLPNMLNVKLKAGDAIFYDSNILHRGVYKGIDESATTTSDNPGRMTLHGSVSLVGHGSERARQVLQHGIGSWIGGEDAAFKNLADDETERRAEEMRQRLISMGTGADLGFSLEG